MKVVLTKQQKAVNACVFKALLIQMTFTIGRFPHSYSFASKSFRSEFFHKLKLSSDDARRVHGRELFVGERYAYVS